MVIGQDGNGPSGFIIIMILMMMTIEWTNNAQPDPLLNPIMMIIIMLHQADLFLAQSLDHEAAAEHQVL